MTSYHHLARPASWWRTLLGTLFIVVTGLVVGNGGYLMVTLAAEIAGKPEVDGFPSFGPLTDLAVAFAMIAVFLPATLLAARWFQRRPAGTLSSVAGRLRIRWLLICLGVAAVAVLSVAFLASLPGSSPDDATDFAGWGPFATATIVLLLVVPVQAAAEEYVCRGWLLQSVGAWFRSPWVAILPQAVIFGALHGWGTPWGFADLFIFGVVTGWLTIRTGGLEAAIALHVCNNLLGSVVAAAFGQLTIDETAADLPWSMAAIDVAMILAYAAVILWLTRRRERGTNAYRSLAALASR
ncbi:lysostaphin resistance A-like protein [Actinoplanes sp. CA-015351]|uniref:CPBP family intramembrane glutamic endopeptidase n=1 Tax=Actinoplanes sp. CA-015351 TaxID=3239897 RepID=UPI003D9637E5